MTGISKFSTYLICCQIIERMKMQQIGAQYVTVSQLFLEFYHLIKKILSNVKKCSTSLDKDLFSEIIFSFIIFVRNLLFHSQFSLTLFLKYRRYNCLEISPPDPQPQLRLD